MWAGIQSSGATKTFPVFGKGSKESNFLVNNVVLKKPLHFLILLFEEAPACACWELNVVAGACKKGDANTDILEALKSTVMMLYPFETHLVLSMCPKLLLPLFVWNLISCIASPWCPNSHDLPGQLRADAALLKYLLSTQVPMCFPNHYSLQLWKWTLIRPRSMYCFNVSVETCAREHFFFFYKQNPDPKQTLMAVFAVGLPLQQNKWQLDTFCSRHTSTVLANTTFQLGLFTLSIKSLAVSVVFGSGYSFVNKEFCKCEIFRWLSSSIMQSFCWRSEECKVSGCMLAFREWGGCSMTLFCNLVFGCAKVSCSLMVCFTLKHFGYSPGQ